MDPLLQIMLVDGFKGRKVQDVKKVIQKMMVDNVCGSVYVAFLNALLSHNKIVARNSTLAFFLRFPGMFLGHSIK